MYTYAYARSKYTEHINIPSTWIMIVENLKCRFGPIDDETMGIPRSQKLSFLTCFQHL